ncbi:hypothetical protein MTO96_014529 [Rhipicephalus appendiculatus]
MPEAHGAIVENGRAQALIRTSESGTEVRTAHSTARGRQASTRTAHVCATTSGAAQATSNDAPVLVLTGGHERPFSRVDDARPHRRDSTSAEKRPRWLRKALAADMRHTVYSRPLRHETLLRSESKLVGEATVVARIRARVSGAGMQKRRRVVYTPKLWHLETKAA